MAKSGRYVRLGGRRWRVAREKLDSRYLGFCDWDERTIRVARDLEGIDLLDTLLHEAIHALARYLDEDVVEELGSDLSKLIVAHRDELKGLFID